MKKKVVALCAVFALALSLCTTASAGVVKMDRVYFENLAKTATKISVDASYLGDKPNQTVYLVAAYVDKTTGEIKEIKEDHKSVTGASSTLSVDMTDYSSSCELTCYMWDSLNGRTPIDNVAPAPSTEAEAQPGTNSVSLSWNAADDDYNAVHSYNIYNNGCFVGNSQTTSFTDVSLARLTDNDYTIKSVDTEGLESSDGVQVSATTTSYPYTVIRGEKGTEINNGVVFIVVDPGGSTYQVTEATEKDGLACRQTVEYNRSDGSLIRSRFPIQFDQATMDHFSELTMGGTTANNYKMEIVYYDEGTGAVRADWHNGKSLGGGAQLFNCTNKQQWVTKTVSLSGARFDIASTNAGDNYCNMRIYDQSNVNLKIRRITIAHESEFVEDNARVYVDETVAIPSSSMNFKLPAEMSIENKNDIPCMYAPSGEVFNLCVDKAKIGSSKSDVTVEVTFIADEGDGIELSYASTAGNKTIAQEYAASEKVQKIRFKLTDAKFNDDAATPDFSIKTKNGNPIYVKEIRAF